MNKEKKYLVKAWNWYSDTWDTLFAYNNEADAYKKRNAIEKNYLALHKDLRAKAKYKRFGVIYEKN